MDDSFNSLLLDCLAEHRLMLKGKNYNREKVGELALAVACNSTVKFYLRYGFSITVGDIEDLELDFKTKSKLLWMTYKQRLFSLAFARLIKEHEVSDESILNYYRSLSDKDLKIEHELGLRQDLVIKEFDRRKNERAMA